MQYHRERGLCFDTTGQLPSKNRPNIVYLMEWIGQVSFVEVCYNQYKDSVRKPAIFYANHNV